MFELADKQVLVIGLDRPGRAACELLRRRGARVLAVDVAREGAARDAVARLRALGVEVQSGAAVMPERRFDLVVISPTLPAAAAQARALAQRGLPVISELELAHQQAACLTIAIAGTNGKSTTGKLIESILTREGREVSLAGGATRPACAVVDQSKELDFLVWQASAFQLEWTKFFRPAVAVLLNLAVDPLERYPDPADYARACARLFANQQPFDWAVVQSEALARLRALQLPLPAKVVTFSATDPQADIYLDRGLLVSRAEDWAGPLLDLDRCRLRGPHNAENLMATLAVGRALRLPLEAMVATLQACRAGPHRCEVVAEIDGVQFINDAKAGNVDALQKALLAARPGPGRQPNVWLIAGGRDQGLAFHDAGPLLTRHVKGAWLLGAAAEKMRAAWSLFTPCTPVASLLEAVAEAAKRATRGDVVLLSPACSSFDQFRNYQQCGESFCRAVKSIGGGAPVGDPNIHDNRVAA